MTTLDPFPTAYTPLESLLLFQALRVDGVASISFSRISDQLKSVPLIHNDPAYDLGRLSPDALRQLYLHLLKEEVKQDLDRKASAVNGDVSPGSRKRKAASPSLPTVTEATQHAHLIPQLVSRLYARYRDVVVRRMRDDERKIAVLTREIREIESGQWDERLLRQRASSRAQSPKVSPAPHPQQPSRRPEHAQHHTEQSAAPGPGAASQPKRYSQAKIDAVINHGPEPDAGQRQSASSTSLPPLSEMAPESPQLGIPSQVPGPGPNTAPIQGMQPTPAHTVSPSPSSGHQSPYAAQHHQARPGSVSNPQTQQVLSRPSSSPRPILPPVPGMNLPAAQSNGSPRMPGHHIQPHPLPPQPYHQQRAVAGPSPTGDVPFGYAGAPLPPHGPIYYQQSPYTDQKPVYPSQPAYRGQVRPNSGFALSPYQASPHGPSMMVPQQQTHAHHPASHASRPPPNASSPHQAPATAPRLAARTNPVLVSKVLSALATPTRPRLRPLWKSDLRPSTRATPVLRDSPAYEPLSPTLGRRKTPVRETRRTQNARGPSVDRLSVSEASTRTRTSKRKQHAHDRSPPSVVSSLADESTRRTRSQSVSTVAGVNLTVDDRPGSRNGVKDEPLTPANLLEDADSITVPVMTPATRPMTRKRRGTLQSAPQPASKRKRQESPATSLDHQDDLSTPPPRSDKIIATRNFAKMSSALLHDIHSHKNAYRFERPVRNKEAPGYSDIIYQPQDLKSIRAAITAGMKVITAATTASDSPAATPTVSAARSGSDGSTTVELDRTLDVVPPKAVVNGAQLEKELMRMFANAFMFNPGEDGVAAVTKEFFLDVEQKINDWRSIERENTTVGGGGGDGDDDGKVKRRKL